MYIAIIAKMLKSKLFPVLFQACIEKRRNNYPPHVMKALDGVPYVAKHLKDEDDGGKVLYRAYMCHACMGQS